MLNVIYLLVFVNILEKVVGFRKKSGRVRADFGWYCFFVVAVLLYSGSCCEKKCRSIKVCGFWLTFFYNKEGFCYINAELSNVQAICL